MSFLLIPLFITCFNFRVAQHDSASCVWTPVRGSTKYREWFTTPCVATLLSRRSRFLYALQSSVCISVPGRIHLSIIGCRVAASLRLTTLKYPLQGVYSVVTRPKTQTSLSALLPRLFWEKNWRNNMSRWLILHFTQFYWYSFCTRLSSSPQNWLGVINALFGLFTPLHKNSRVGKTR